MSPKRTGMHFLFCFVDLALIAPNIRWIRRFSAAAQHLIMVHFNLSPLPVAYGFAVLMLGVFRGAEEVDLGVLFAGFQEYSRILSTKLLQAVYTFLWSLLLLIPGIIKYYSYGMTDYILKDEPELCNNAAIERSMAMMEGNKMKLFLLDLSFIGWAILCLFTFGLGFFVLQPYMQVARAAFYEDLKAQQGGFNINVEVNIES